MGDVDQSLASELRVLFDEAWYLERYPDVRASGSDPMQHYIQYGINEGRDPNGFFEGGWYRDHYDDVAESHLDPLLHYLRFGAVQLRNPHPRFDAAWYAEQHPEAAANPLVYHLLFGRRRAWLAEPPISGADFLPSSGAVVPCPADVVTDVIIPVYRGLKETRRCLGSVLADPSRPPGRVIVVDDASPEPGLPAYLEELRAAGRIVLIRNERNLGFVASTNAGIRAAGDHDVVLLNSDTEVPPEWLSRLAGHAYSAPRVATVSPFSNNATICGYPSVMGGPLPFAMSMEAVDEICREINAGRRVEVPTTVGFCMYIRRAALNELGALDAAAFGRGYGEENDFCLRASSRGWRHLLACDTFVYHKGSVSFLGDAAPNYKRAQQVLAERWPDYAGIVDRFMRRDPAAPFRFAATAALFRKLGRPVILLISHGLGGGVQRHINELIQHAGLRALFLMISSSARGIRMTVPQLEGHSAAELPSDRLEELVLLLQSANVSRVHLHHTLGLDLDLRAFIHKLSVPFDFTVHDYFGICPQVNLLPWFDAQYCGEPGPAQCNACIADRPSHYARDITSWRREHAWLFHEADRVICPSEDVRTRLARHGLGERAVVAAHEPVAAGEWQMTVPPLTKGQKLRVAVLGVLAQQKGAAAVAAVAELPDSAMLDVRLIGYPEQELPDAAKRRVRVTGAYEEGKLAELIAKAAPHVIWFPAQWPETYSYTLTAAIDAGSPIVASAIGAFPERLAGRQLTWLVDPAASAATWLEVFNEVRSALLSGAAPEPCKRAAQPDFYCEGYVSRPRSVGLIDLRRPGRSSVVVVPERFPTGGMTPCAYIRLLQPLDHLAGSAGLNVIIADAEEAQRYRADAIVTHRHAVDGAEAIRGLILHCEQTGAALIYDLDDDLLDIPRDHPDAALLRPKARSVDRLVREASCVWTSTPALARKLEMIRADVRVVPNALDERLWANPPGAREWRQSPMRILFMGTATHQADFELVEPALARLHEQFGGRVHFDMIGVSAGHPLPAWVNRPNVWPSAGVSYPGFVNWICQHPGWDVGIAPLGDTAFNSSKSAIKAMDYAALGLTVVASDVEAYRHVLGPETGALLVRNTTAAWVEILARLLRNPQLRRELAAKTRAAFAARWTLAAQREMRELALREAIASRQRAPVEVAQPQRRAAARPASRRVMEVRAV